MFLCVFLDTCVFFLWHPSVTFCFSALVTRQKNRFLNLCLVDLPKKLRQQVPVLLQELDRQVQGLNLDHARDSRPVSSSSGRESVSESSSYPGLGGGILIHVILWRSTGGRDVDFAHAVLLRVWLFFYFPSDHATANLSRRGSRSQLMIADRPLHFLDRSVAFFRAKLCGMALQEALIPYIVWTQCRFGETNISRLWACFARERVQPLAAQLLNQVVQHKRSEFLQTGLSSDS